jgi:hypothetical protein
MDRTESSLNEVKLQQQLTNVSESDLFRAHTRAFIQFYLEDEQQQLMHQYTKKNGTIHKQRYMNELIKRFDERFQKIYLNKAWVDTLLGNEIIYTAAEDGASQEFRFVDGNIDIEQFCTCKSYYLEVKAMTVKHQRAASV